MSWFQEQWNRFAGPNNDPNAPIQHVEIAWGRDRFSIPIKEQARGQATLRDLKNLIVQHTGVPYEQVKLIYHGLILKDDRQPLVCYGLANGARLGLVGTRDGVPIVGDRPGAKASIFDGQDGDAQFDKGGKRKAGSSGANNMSRGEELARRKKERESDTSEAGLLQRVDEAVQGVHTDVVPELEAFELATGSCSGKQAASIQRSAKVSGNSMQGAEPISPTSPSGNTFEILGKQHRKLSELLLRALLALDGVAVNSETTRARRKAAVKEVQAFLDRLDAAWQAYKERDRHAKSAALSSSPAPASAA